MKSCHSAERHALPTREPRNNIVVPYCHTSLIVCNAATRTIAFIDSSSHLSWRIVDSFLGGDIRWRIGGGTSF